MNYENLAQIILTEKSFRIRKEVADDFPQDFFDTSYSINGIDYRSLIENDAIIQSLAFEFLKYFKLENLNTWENGLEFCKRTEQYFERIFLSQKILNQISEVVLQKCIADTSYDVFNLPEIPDSFICGFLRNCFLKHIPDHLILSILDQINGSNKFHYYQNAMEKSILLNISRTHQFVKDNYLAVDLDCIHLLNIYVTTIFTNDFDLGIKLINLLAENSQNYKPFESILNSRRIFSTEEFKQICDKFDLIGDDNFIIKLPNL